METSDLGLPGNPRIPQTPLEAVPSLVHSFIFIHPFAHSENTRQPCAVCTACGQPEGRAFASCCVFSLSFLICEEGLALPTYFCLHCMMSQRWKGTGWGEKEEKDSCLPRASVLPSGLTSHTQMEGFWLAVWTSG